MNSVSACEAGYCLEMNYQERPGLGPVRLALLHRTGSAQVENCCGVFQLFPICWTLCPLLKQTVCLAMRPGGPRTRVGTALYCQHSTLARGGRALLHTIHCRQG